MQKQNDAKLKDAERIRVIRLELLSVEDYVSHGGQAVCCSKGGEVQGSGVGKASPGQKNSNTSTPAGKL